MIELPAAIREEIEDHPDITASVYLEWVPKVESAFKILNLQTAWNNLIGRIDEASLFGLKICDDLLSRRRAEVEISEEDIETIHKSIRELFDDVFAADLTEEVRGYLIEHLKQIDRAIQEFRISGAEPIQASVESVYGAALLNPKVAKEAYGTEVGKRFWKIVGRVAVLLSMVANFTVIAEYADVLLPESLPAEQTDHSTDGVIPPDSSSQGERSKDAANNGKT